MGIASFFPWFHRTFSKYVDYLRAGENTSALRISVDNVLIDMNGIFHPAAQKVFRYGKYSKPLLTPAREPSVKDFYTEVGREIDRIVALVPPTKRLILCVDGVAPVAKQVQQRQRRYKSSPEPGFDPNSLTPGTQLMHDLCNYVETYIKRYTDIEVVWSPSSVPGEGEMKLMNFVKFYAGRGDSSAVYGLDADILLLSLCTMKQGQRMYVVREREIDHAVIDVARVRESLVSKLRWRGAADELLVTDFVFMCFLVGNDFLKRAPGIDIVTGSIEKLIGAYKDTCQISGHITRMSDGECLFNHKTLGLFFQNLGTLEQQLFDIKARNVSQYIEDPLFNKYIGSSGFDVEGYRREYYAAKFADPVDRVCREYIEGLEWVLRYYTGGVPSWKWFYPYNYSPFISDIAHVHDYRTKQYGRTVPYDQFFQLMLVLPPRSMGLLPPPLDRMHVEFPGLFPVGAAPRDRQRGACQRIRISAGTGRRPAG
jgi:5'-3' exoribonuclease 1